MPEATLFKILHLIENQKQKAMKNVKLLFLLLATVLFAACNDDDDSPINECGTPALNGQWHLRNVSGGFGGADEDFAQGEIIWDFNTANQTVHVTNNNTDVLLIDLLPTGTYDYAITGTDDDSLCSLIISVDGLNYGCYTLGLEEMTFDQSFADGFRYTFRR